MVMFLGGVGSVGLRCKVITLIVKVHCSVSGISWTTDDHSVQHSIGQNVGSSDRSH